MLAALWRHFLGAPGSGRSPSGDPAWKPMNVRHLGLGVNAFLRLGCMNVTDPGVPQSGIAEGRREGRRVGSGRGSGGQGA
jgi:hypothetical protein